MLAGEVYRPSDRTGMMPRSPTREKPQAGVVRPRLYSPVAPLFIKGTYRSLHVGRRERWLRLNPRKSWNASGVYSRSRTGFRTLATWIAKPTRRIYSSSLHHWPRMDDIIGTFAAVREVRSGLEILWLMTNGEGESGAMGMVYLLLEDGGKDVR